MPSGLEELGLDKNFVTYFEIRSGRTLCIAWKKAISCLW